MILSMAASSIALRSIVSRSVAACSVGGVDLADLMVRQGLALDWPQYSQRAFAEAQRRGTSAVSGGVVSCSRGAIASVCDSRVSDRPGCPALASSGVLPFRTCPRPMLISRGVEMADRQFDYDLALRKMPRMTHRTMPAAEYRSIASAYRAQSRQAGISEKRASLLANISRTFSGLASQLEMLEADVAAE